MVAAQTPKADYKVALDIYSGPLELLLFLIKREEVDIRDIPISRITTQYLDHVKVLQQIDINLAGEFLVMAATLMEIKSRMLIPPSAIAPEAQGQGPTSVEEIADPRYELVRQLLEYKHYKDLAEELRRRAGSEALRFARAPAHHGAQRAPLDLEDLDVMALLEAFTSIMSSIGHSAYRHEVVYDDTPISLHQADILDRLAREGALTLQDMFVGRKSRSELIGLFLAMLELIRQKRIAVEQLEILGPLRLVLRLDTEVMLFQSDNPAGEMLEASQSLEASPEGELDTTPRAD